MSIIIPKTNLIDDLHLHKLTASGKMGQLISIIDQHSHQKMIKTASVDNDQLIKLFSNMLMCLKMEADDSQIKEIINKISSKSTNINQQAAITKDSKERKDDIKIVSKHIKDSHYQVDLSKDIIQQNNKKVFMVSCYARDAYLGRYLIKRNYFYTQDREKFADEAYDEIFTKINAIKDRYYNEVIKVSDIVSQMKTCLDGVISEIKMEEDSLGTTINR
jgi:hypothetical protein